MLHHIVEALKDTKFGHHMHDKIHDFKEIMHAEHLPDDATAQFASGLLYGASNGTIDERDYIVDCAWTCPVTNRLLSAAFTSYNAGEDRKGNKRMRRAEPFWRFSMLTCWETNHYFTRMDHNKDAFFARDDWKSIARDNYNANQDYVDQQWQFCLDSWNTGVYFNAGMFYARVWDKLAFVPEAELLQF